MAFDTTGTYIQVTGATTAVPGAVVQSSIWNSIHTDLGGALTQYMQEFIAQPSNRNIIWMNGSFEIWQRTTGLSPVVNLTSPVISYTADRWYALIDVNEDSTINGVAGLVSQSNFAYRFRRNAGQTGTASSMLGFPFGQDEVIAMKGKNVTLSFLVKAGANWSPASGTLTMFLFTGTGAGGAARRANVPYTGELTPISTTVNLTPGGPTIAVAVNSTITIPTNITQAELAFLWNPTGTAGAADDFTIDDIQLEVQNSPSTWIATAYDRIPFPQMLQGCKRHYQKTFDYAVFPGAGSGRGNALSVIAGAASRTGIYWRYPVEVRGTGTIGLFNPDGGSANWQNTVSGASSTSTVDTSTQDSKGVFILSATVTAIDQVLIIHAQQAAGIT